MSTVVCRGADGRNVGHDLTGRVCDWLTVLGPTDRRDNGYVVWRARCRCGKVIERPSYRFIRGMKSCGCRPISRQRIPDNGAHINAIFKSYIGSARSRGLVFELSKAEVRHLVTQDCRYCGGAPEPRATHRNLSGLFAWNGIDRSDPKIGYVPSNCVPCCPRCNFAKWTMDADEFREWIKRVATHLGV